MEPVSPWRTVISVLVLALFVLIAFALFLLKGQGEFGAKGFDTVSWTLMGMSIALATKATLQHASSGSGLKAALATFVTTATPGDPAPAERAKAEDVPAGLAKP